MENSHSQEQIRQFVQDGYVRLDNAFPRELADQAQEILWKDLPVNPADPSTWTQPVIRLGMYEAEPFVKAANTPLLHNAFNQLVGSGQWIPLRSMGTFPVRFPSPQDPGDTGWHVDAGFPGADPGNYLEWRINVRSRGRALLMLFLFSDTGPDDAPTRLLPGSHRHVARLLSEYGDSGLDFMELAGRVNSMSSPGEEVATGPAGTVYLCHPFLVHAAQSHQGLKPKFMAQPPLLLREPLSLDRKEGSLTPLEQSIRLALA